MSKAVKKSILSTALKGRPKAPKPQPDPLMAETNGDEGKKMIAGHFSQEVKDAMGMARIKARKNLQQLMGEAFNLVCAKYGVPEAYTD